MKPHSALVAVSVLLALICLVTAYALVGGWLILLAIPAILIFWVVAGRQGGFWMASALLAIYLGLAAVGIAMHAASLLMAIGCIFAICGWELSDLRGRTTPETLRDGGSLLEERRLQSLAVVGLLSALLAALASALPLHLAFGVVAVLALLSIGCVLYSVHVLRRATTH